MARNKNPRRQTEMNALIEEWKESRISKPVFCKNRSINIHTFNYWCQKIKKQNTSPGFIELRSVRNQIIPQSIRLTYPNGVSLELPSTADVELIGPLINPH
jgi:hypothetical protein